MEEWRFGNMEEGTLRITEKCRSRNMEEGREKVNEQGPNKLLCLNNDSSLEKPRLNENEQRSSKLLIFLNNYRSTHESNNQKVVAVIKPIIELSEEIVREILIRVSYKSHYKLMSVCKSWNAMVNNPKFYEDRMRFGRCEEFICLIETLHEGWVPSKLGQHLYNPAQKEWEAAPSLPTGNHKSSQLVTIYNPVQDKWEAATFLPTGYLFKFRNSRCVSIKHRLVFMGLYKQDTYMPTKAVLVYDFSTCIWKQGIDMPMFCSSFACVVSPQDGLIYIAGGCYGSKNAMCYSVEKEKWEILPEMQQKIIECEGFFNNDKFYVISCCHRNIEIFDTNTRLWATLENMWTCGWFPDCCVFAFGSLYYFEDGVKEYDCKENVWRQIEHFPSTLDYVSFATIWQDKIFLVGYDDERCKETFYMFQPPKSGTMISERWTAIERLFDIPDYVMSVVNIKV